MLFELIDKDKAPICIIGKYSFTFVDPGPKDVDLESLTQQELDQFIYNARKGVLAVEDPDALIKFSEKSWAVAKTYSTPKETPVKSVSIPVEDSLEEDLVPLRKILKKSVASIKKEVTSMTAGKIRKLLDLEMAGKNRKSIKSFFNNILEKHAQDVLNSINKEDKNATEYFIGCQIGSSNTTDVVESEVEKVNLNPSEAKVQARDYEHDEYITY